MLECVFQTRSESAECALNAPQLHQDFIAFSAPTRREKLKIFAAFPGLQGKGGGSSSLSRIPCKKSLDRRGSHSDESARQRPSQILTVGARADSRSCRADPASGDLSF